LLTPASPSILQQGTSKVKVQRQAVLLLPT
jgi:hypothetical protein